MSKSTSSQRSASNSPRRMPVLTASSNKAAKRLPAAAARSARACSTVRATTSTCVLRGGRAKRHDVSWQQTPPDGLGEGAVQDGMQVADRGGGEARRKLVLVEALEVLWGKSTEPDATERWDGVYSNAVCPGTLG